jgi:hypothetical protein
MQGENHSSSVEDRMPFFCDVFSGTDTNLSERIQKSVAGVLSDILFENIVLGGF